VRIGQRVASLQPRNLGTQVNNFEHQYITPNQSNFFALGRVDFKNVLLIIK